jgi:flagella basal body P-ring formation protein FlgA
VLPLLASLLLAAAPTPVGAVQAALAVPGASAEVEAVHSTSARGCDAAAWETLRAVDASGSVALRFTGRDSAGGACEGFAWASVRVRAPALVATRAIAAGEPLAGAVALSSAEVRPGRAGLTALPGAAVAARPVRAGAPLSRGDLRVGPRPGEPVTVVVRAGALELEQPARAVACPGACALLPGGRRVEGRFEDGHILVEAR